MRPFTLITLILVFFFFARQIRLLATLATGSFAVARLIPDIVIAGLILFYVTYSLGVRPHNGPRLDRVKLCLLAILAVAFLQSVYFAITFGGQGEALLVRAFTSFRRVFMPLSLLFLFSYLIKTEIAKNGDLIFKRLSTLLTTFLLVAIAYNILEWTLRTTVPQFNFFYLDQYVLKANYLGGANPPQHGEDIPIALLRNLTGLSIKRVHGVAVEMYISGGVIFLCYLFHVFMSGKFKVLSILNCLVFVALLLSGSRTFLFPFLVLNAVIFARRYGRKNFFAPILVGIILAGGVILVVRLMIPIFASQGQGYFENLTAVVDPFKENLGLFIFGKGPAYTLLYSSDLLILELQGQFAWVNSVGLMAILLEVGLIMWALFVWFHIIVFKGNGNISGRRQVPDPYIKRLKITIVLGMLVTLAHWPILFDRNIIVFHVLFVALLYTWSKFGMTSHEPAPAGPARAQLRPASLG